MGLWKQHRGVHCDKNAKLVTPASEELMKGIIRQPNTFYGGDVLESDSDLTRHNFSNVLKFTKLKSNEPSDELTGMSVAQLREFAKSENLEVPAGLSKADMVTAIRGLLVLRPAVQPSTPITEPPESDANDRLEDMSIAELRSLVEAEELTVDGDSRVKENLIKAIRESPVAV